MDLKEKMLGRVKPSASEQKEAENKVSKFLERLNKKLKDARAIIGGSFAKGTWLKDNHDVDIFVLFNNDHECSDELEKVLKKVFGKVTRIHGSRDYFNINIYDLNFEIVPVYKIERPKDAKNITDISPLHAKWVRSKLNTELADDIRLAKLFFKAQGIYGAETYIKGFSGYVIEILTIHFGGFDKLIKTGSKMHIWDAVNPRGKKRVIIDKEKLSPLVVVDPVQDNRNAAAALSAEKFNKFVKACNAYLSQPSEKFFEIKKVKLSDLKDKTLVIRASPLEGTKDVVGTKLYVVYGKILYYLTVEGFEVTSSGWSWDEEGLYWFNVKSKELSKYKEQAGPPLDIEEHVRSFKAKHKGKKIVEKDGRVYVVLLRKHVKLKDYVIYILKSDEIKKRVKRIKVV